MPLFCSLLLCGSVALAADAAPPKPVEPVDPATLKDRVRLALGQELALEFQREGDRLLQPKTHKADDAGKPLVRVRLELTEASPVPPPRPGATRPFVHVDNPYDAPLTYRVLARFKGSKDFFPITDGLEPVPPQGGSNKCWGFDSQVEEVVLYHFSLSREPQAFDFGFEDAAVGAVPRGWTVTRTGSEGSEWKVIEDKSSPNGPKVLAQLAESPSSVFNLCVADDARFRDVEVTVSFKAVKGRRDQGGGIVWRYADAKNYYIARFNPLEDNYRVYKVIDGKRTQLATHENLKAPAGEWHTLTIRMRGDAIQCLLNGKPQLEARDDAFTQPGKVGLWTKADAQTRFDDFRARELTK